MLIYNLFIFSVGFLLYMDFMVHKNDVHLRYGANRIALGDTFMYLALGVIIFFAGFRFEIGYDYQKYLAGYLFDDELKHWEPFFNFFVRVIREIDFVIGIQAMFLFFSALTIIIVYKGLRSLTPHYRLGILFFILIPSLYLNSFSVIRQGISIGILLYGLQYITRDNPDYKKYALVAFVAFMFHYSSIFVAFVYVIGAQFFQRKHSWILYSFMIFGSLVLSLSNISKFVLLSLPGHYSTYGNMAMDVSPLKILIINVFFLFFMLQKDHFIKTKLDRYLLNSVFIGLLIFNVFSSFVYVSRLAQYFLVAEIILVPVYLHTIKDMLTKKVMLVLFLVYYFFNFNYTLYRDEQLTGVRKHFLIPYKNYFFEEKKSQRDVNLEMWHDYIMDYSLNEEENNE